MSFQLALLISCSIAWRSWLVRLVHLTLTNLPGHVGMKSCYSTFSLSRSGYFNLRDILTLGSQLLEMAMLRKRKSISFPDGG
uniref:Secreted protein n=1 Tax=Picea glauca TaxID=3330 RepID=A0A101LUM7_PICGL|nr:hypothetical protein ABT39_MTgene2452 [Picea glauca]QHR88521.1 hypothetical protein Q903MT_gene2535 [Picea sitchensis]